MGAKKNVIMISEDNLRSVMKEAYKEAIKEYIKEQDRADRKASAGQKTKQLLSSYRRVKAALQDEVELTDDEKKDLRWKFMEDLIENPNSTVNKVESYAIDNVKRRRERLYSIRCIENAMDLYRRECEASGEVDDWRKYREIYDLYISDDPKSIKEIAEQEYVSERTVYNDVNEACNVIAIYLLST